MFRAQDSLLPPTATGLAKALDILEERLFQMPVGMITKDPWVVDVGLLDAFAWEMSVDVWDLDWPEDVKRNVIAISAEVHRFKGTPYAIRTALSAFDVDTDLLEWWEPEAVEAGFEPGSFRVTAYAGRSLYGPTEDSLNTAMLKAMNAVVERTAPVSRKLVFRLGERFRTATGVHSAARQARHQSESGDAIPRANFACHVTQVRSGTLIQRRVEVSFDPAPRPHLIDQSVSLRNTAQAQTVSREYHDLLRGV